MSAWDAAVLLAPDGSLWAWGGTETGLADLFGSKSNSSKVPRRVATDTNWRKVAANAYHMLALKADGSLWSWGKWPGEPGQSDKTSATFPVRVNSDTNWSELTVGVTHCMALKRDGSLWTWGRNHYGQLGCGHTNTAETPIQIGGTWKAIAAGAFNSYALRHDGTLWGWGLDSVVGAGGTHDLLPREIDSGTNWVAIAASSYCLLALQADGSLWLRGQNAKWTAPKYVANRVFPFTRIGDDHDWKSIYCGEQHFFAGKSDGSWWGCGQNNDGQLGLGARQDVLAISAPQRLPYEFEPWAIALASDRGATLVLLKDGTLWTSGIRLGESKPSSKFNRFKSVANKYLRHLPGRPYFAIREYQTDTVPRKLWKLPPDVTHTTQDSTP